MAQVGLIVHHDRPAAAAAARRLMDWLAAGGHGCRLPGPDAAVLGRGDLGVADGEFGAGLDVAVSLGGDGTMLRAVDLVAEAEVPVLGVNLGALGYLTEVDPDAVEEALERVFGGDFRVDERMMLEVAVHSSGDLDRRRWRALNEVVLEKTLSGHTVRVDVTINGRRFTPYAADGLIVATPTGSTAYAFSARGPIVAPNHRALLLTPVSPHMLFDRTLVLEPETVVGLTVAGHRPGALAVDGRHVGTLAPGDRLDCTAAPVPARLVTFGHRDFHQILRAKFGLTDR